MKNKLFLLSVALMFQACSTGTASNVDFAQPDETIAQASKGKSTNASKKMLTQIKASKSTNSLCGANDMQEVNFYDGKLGVSKDFVKKFETSVAAMEEAGSDDSSKFCSGTMVSPDLFLTANHCVEAGTVGQYLAFNYQKGGKQEHFKIVEVVEAGTGLDYALVRAEGKPGEKYGYKHVKSALPAQGDLLTIIQHPSGDPKTVEVGHRGSYNAPYMGYGDLDTMPGSSGSGVIDKDGNVVGVHTNGGCTASGGENKAVAMSDIVKKSKVLSSLAFINEVELPPVPKKK
ncbi:MAG: serine protease [Candidatus Sericytochromatia bacterium]